MTALLLIMQILLDDAFIGVWQSDWASKYVLAVGVARV